MRFPEWTLQQLDQNWMTEYPSTVESSLYVANSQYCSWLLSKLGSGDGKALERLAHYVLNCIPEFRARMRMRAHSTDYDVYCAIEGPTYDFRSELGRYFICECKDWNSPANVTAILKFSSVLRAAKCRFGIMFSRYGITGQTDLEDAKRQLLKLSEGGIIVLIVTESDLQLARRTASWTPIRFVALTGGQNGRDYAARGAAKDLDQLPHLLAHVGIDLSGIAKGRFSCPMLFAHPSDTDPGGSSTTGPVSVGGN